MQRLLVVPLSNAMISFSKVLRPFPHDSIGIIPYFHGKYKKIVSSGAFSAPERRLFCDVRVILDVFLTVAVIAGAAGAVPEFQLRVRDVCPPTDGTAVGVSFLGDGTSLCRTGEFHHGRSGLVLLSGCAADAPIAQAIEAISSSI